MDEELTAYDEIIDFLARGSTSEEVLAFRPSTKAQEQVRKLLIRNKCGDLTTEETLELERLGNLEHLMQLIKARAQLHTAQNGTKTD